MKLTKYLESKLFNQTNPLPVFFLRAGIGLILFFYYLNHHSSLLTLFSYEGIGGTYSNIAKGLSDSVIWMLYFTILTSSLCLAVGFYTRTALVLSTAIHFFFWSACPPANGGWGTALLFYSYILFVCSPGSVVSMDSKGKSQCIESWKIKVIQAMTCSIYIIALLNRIGSEAWASGTAVQIGLSNALLSRSPHFSWHEVSPILSILSYYTLFIEGLGCLLMFLGRYQKYVFLGLLALHLGIELALTVGYWSYLLIFALTSFLPQEWCKLFYKKFKLAPPSLTKTDNFKFQTAAAIFISLIGSLCLFSGIPSNILSDKLQATQDLVRKKLAPLRLNTFTHFAAFRRPTLLEFSCFMVMAEIDNKKEIIYQAERDECMQRKYNLYVEPINSVLAMMYKKHSPYITKSNLQDSNIHLGKYFCAANTATHSRKKVYLIYLASYHKQESLEDQGNKRFSNIFSFDCENSKLFKPASPVIEDLKKTAQKAYGVLSQE